MTSSVTCLCPYSNHAMLEKALVWNQTGQCLNSYSSTTNCSVAGVTLLTELVIITALDGCEDPREYIEVFCLFGPLRFRG